MLNRLKIGLPSIKNLYNKMKTCILKGGVVALFALLAVNVFAQDKIYKKDLSVIACTIKEVGSEDIKYHTDEVPEGVLLSIAIDKVAKVEFANGKELFFKDNFTDPENYADQHKNLVKLNFLEPLNGSTSFSYERSMRPGRSVEGTLGIIGLGWDIRETKPLGAYVGVGMKFLSKPDHYFRKMRYAHILKGFFVKPELILSSYKSIPYEDFFISTNTNTTDKVTVFTGVLMINLGKQWVFDDGFALELFGGVGYGAKSRNDVAQYSIFVGNDVPLAGRAGLRIGFLF